jgi:hypothetical protein
MVDRYLSVIVLPVWSNMTLIISVSAIRLIVRAAAIDLINSLSFWGNLDVLLYSTFRKINLHVSGRYFSINFVNCSNENGFLNISLIPLPFICSKTTGSDEAVKITMFFCTS